MSFATFSLADFEIQPFPRKGGMSVVHKAKHLDDGRYYALKYPARESAEDTATLSMTRERDSLSNLDHPNIVHLYGIGHDGAQRFLVLEWLEESLSDRIAALGPLDWVAFYEYVGRPIIDAIQYAHGRNCVHRDLKPSNVMFTEQKAPRITDFGISRVTNDLRLGKTFMGAGSQPWTPSEQDDGIYSESRDAYSWAALCVACLAGRQDFRRVQDLRDAASRMREVAPADLLLSCLDESPAKRPKSAKQLLWDLDDYHRYRTAGGSTARIIGIDISSTAHQKLSELVPSEASPSKKVRYLLEDFDDPCDILRLPDGDLEFTGKAFRIRTFKPAGQIPWLIVKDVFPASQLPDYGHSVSMLIKFEERSACDKFDLNELRANVAFLSAFLMAAVVRAEEEQRAKDRERYLTMQLDVLLARIRALRELPTIEYRDGKWAAGDFNVQVLEDDLPELGEQRIIRTSEGILVFEVTRISEGRITLRSVGPTRFQAPAEGKLLVDTVAQRRALERQEEALKSVRSAQTVMPELKRIILTPKEADPPELGGRPPSEGLSEDKQKVLDAALGLRQLMVVRGPPGTGKTTLIAEIVKAYLTENPLGRVLIAAQTHIAIDHVVEKLLRSPGIKDRVVRVARTDEEKLSDAVKPALLHKRVSSWCKQAAAKSREFASGRGVTFGLDASEVELSVRLETLVLASERLHSVEQTLVKGDAELDEALQEVKSDPGNDLLKVESATVATRTVAQLSAERKQLTQRIDRLRQELTALGPDGSALAELPSDGLRDWLTVLEKNNPLWTAFRRELEVQVSWLDVLGELKRIEGLVLRAASVVAGTCVGLSSSDGFFSSKFDLCIIDEASKAAATEALIPMVRATRCLLVGDPLQLPPFDYGTLELDGYSESEMKETLLDYLIDRLMPECVFELTHQHRMCKGIGDLIGEVFYEGKLVNTRSDSDRLDWIKMLYPRPVIWFDTKGLFQRRQGHTYVNVGEQNLVLDLLAGMNRAADRIGRDASVAVIAGYAGQARALDSRIQRGLFPRLGIEVATVDSFQGKEADICIYSVTLNNSSDYLGFLKSAKRLNVALSRPRDLLLIIGDQEFCYRVSGENPFTRIIDYLEANSATCETRNAHK
jgi:serine/threonine protein kinase